MDFQDEWPVFEQARDEGKCDFCVFHFKGASIRYGASFRGTFIPKYLFKGGGGDNRYWVFVKHWAPNGSLSVTVRLIKGINCYAVPATSASQISA